VGRFGMRSTGVPGVFADLPTEGYRRLSRRVIEQALRDVVRLNESASDRRSACAFLCGSPMLEMWCELAQLDPAKIAAHAERLMDGRGARP
jgi:hypothetical protein